VNTPLGQAYLIPFKDKRGQLHAQLIVGYQGMMDLARRSGDVGSIQARCVYEGDEFEYEFGLEPMLKHRPCPSPGKLQYVYAVARMKAGGEPVFTVLSADKVEGFRKRSRARNEGPWVTDYDAMAMKTAVRRLFTWLPKSAEVAQAITLDDATEITRRQSDHFDPAITEALAELGGGDEPETEAEGDSVEPEGREPGED
jgi:recombination protein RecT